MKKKLLQESIVESSGSKRSYQLSKFTKGKCKCDNFQYHQSSTWSILVILSRQKLKYCH